MGEASVDVQGAVTEDQLGTAELAGSMEDGGKPEKPPVATLLKHRFSGLSGGSLFFPDGSQTEAAAKRVRTSLTLTDSYSKTVSYG